jgi:small subunit ribosomal protein S24e
MQSDAPVTLRTRKFITNRLLQRRQMVVDVLHPSRPNVSKAELSEKLAVLYKTDKSRVVTFGFKTHFGGGRSTGFALIYDDEAAHKRFEPRYRLVRVSVCEQAFRINSYSTCGTQAGMATKVEKASRKLRKERKNRAKKVRALANPCDGYVLTDHSYLSRFGGQRKPRLLNHQRRESSRVHSFLYLSHLPVISPLACRYQKSSLHELEGVYRIYHCICPHKNMICISCTYFELNLQRLMT